ncbi:MAG: hypothetical protein HON47_05045 [Candidatus Diapherotrites archaeon]|uniref:Uncharacterized protein n=1 Tax=Candidatus Iainarchaeum sp. TaxID=3101447 RepID=A0A8T5GFZ5_9ARCH|nr:hypothetical protein [Candidatus Diapherotrites archaeon]
MPAKNKSGEKLIESILDKHKIRYDRKKRMKLKKDTKKFRIPDFYLQDYNLAIEFFGSWIVPGNKKFEKREQKRFMEKVGVYHHNKMHTLYLYPTDLRDAEKLIVKATKQISNLPAIYRAPLYWNIPWMKEKKIQKPKAEDFETKETTKKVKIEEKVIEETTKVTHITPNHKVLVREAPINDFKDPVLINNTFSNILLFLTGFVILLFLIHAATVLTNALELIEPAFGLFLFVTGVLVVLSAIYALQRNIFHGFIIVAIVFVILALIGILMLGNNVWGLVTTIIIILAIVPTEYYMITTNKR